MTIAELIEELKQFPQDAADSVEYYPSEPDEATIYIDLRDNSRMRVLREKLPPEGQAAMKEIERILGPMDAINFAKSYENKK